ncbi:Breast cancer anti-estrogen resistance protein 1 [Armadillidium nasatum]|uniref:Breast cancer anti-estrogen resistance protein 1 n=1 Tax=Armadillidium nasatum TaxID=96803 RepID=A0A5N5SXU7_9CRUS|nr:Breast cancer anti-estrogen resistance protein 1 [Armadillidium nasatum]
MLCVNCVARALYDNVAESPDELAFCKGDLLTVLEQNTAGLEGWWLCSLRGRQGICPGNRLRIVPGCYDTGSGLTSTLTGVHNLSSGGNPGLQRGNSLPQQQQQQRTPSKKVVTPKRVGDVFTYDIPKPHAQLDYDVPPNRYPTEGKSSGSEASRLSRSSSLRYDTPRPLMRSSLEQYDTPRPLECQYDSPSSRPLYDSPRQALTTQQQHYDTPRASDASSGTPRSLIKGIRGGQPVSANKPSMGTQQTQDIQNQNLLLQEYDVPRPLSSEGDPRPSDRSSNISLMSCDSQLSTSSSASSLPASESLSLSSIGGGESNRSSLESHDVYDIPPEPRRFKPKLPPREHKDLKEEQTPQNTTYDTPQSNLTWSKSGEAVYDVPPQVSRDTRSSDTFDSILNRLSSGSDSSGADMDLANFKELPLELNSAVETLIKCRQEALSAVEKIAILKSLKFEFENVDEVKLSVYRLKDAVDKVVNFGRGSVGNALRAGEHKLAKRLSRLIDPIESASVLTCDAWKRLQSLPPGAAGKNIAQDQFTQVASITTSLGENVRHLANVIQSNAHLCFKRSQIIEKPLNTKVAEDEDKTPVQERPLPEIPIQKSDEFSETRTLLEDYDYVNLESKESVEREHKEIMESLPTELRKSYDNLIKQSHMTVDSNHKKILLKNSTKAENDNQNNSVTPTQLNPPKNIVRLDANDRQVLNFYGVQAKLHLQNLNSAIDAFLLTIENNQPPKIFIAHSKFVILSAHKLVYIGDTIHRNVMNTEIRTCVLNCTNALCDAMKNTVTAAKTAALQFPSVTAVQAMVDAFVSISHLSNNLKKAICRD